jgi:hypothetical protein
LYGTQMDTLVIFQGKIGFYRSDLHQNDNASFREVNNLSKSVGTGNDDSEGFLVESAF